MNKIVLDTSAWIEYFAGSEKGQRVRERLNREGREVFITGLIVAEISVKFLKETRPVEEVVRALGSLASLVPFDFRLAQEAAEIYVHERKTRNKFGLADAHVLAAARIVGGKVITFDHDFNGLNEAVVLK